MFDIVSCSGGVGRGGRDGGVEGEVTEDSWFCDELVPIMLEILFPIFGYYSTYYSQLFWHDLSLSVCHTLRS